MRNKEQAYRRRILWTRREHYEGVEIKKENKNKMKNKIKKKIQIQIQEEKKEVDIFKEKEEIKKKRELVKYRVRHLKICGVAVKS